MQQATREELRYEQLIEKLQQGNNARMSEQDAIVVAGKLYTRGEYRQAEFLCRKLIDQRPAMADAHSILGVSLHAQGQGKEGVAAIKRAIKLNPRAAAYRSNLGELYRQQRNLADAIVSLQEAIEIDPRNPQAHNNLGIVRFESRAYGAAVEAYRKAIALNPDFPEAYNNLGNALRKMDDTDGAVEAYRAALARREHYPEAHNNLGTLLHEQGESEEAKLALQKALQQNPRYLEAYNNLASVYHGERKDIEALGLLRQALQLKENDVRSLIQAARIQHKRANFAAAESALSQVLQADPDNVEALTVRGSMLHDLDRYDEALASLSRAVELQPDSWEANAYLGVVYRAFGRLDEARTQLSKAIELNDKSYAIYASLSEIVDLSKDKAFFKKIEAAMKAIEGKEDVNASSLHYAYAKALDDNKKHEQALEQYVLGGALKRKTLPYNEAETFAFFDRVKATFSADFLSAKTFAGIDTDRPVFIIGMPRSGSTLVEQILASHGSIHGAGEVKHLPNALDRLRNRFPDISRYPEMVGDLSPEQFEMLGKDYLAALTAGADGKAHVTDKLLTNYFFVGLLHTLFPRAKFINTRRDPVDTCLSTFTTLFKDELPHSYVLGELGLYYRQYDALMAHWNAVLPEGSIHVVDYEDVVADTEKASRALIAFLGLEWEDACLDFHKSTRPVRTASVAQVRKPIYKTSVKRWKKYGAGLQPLIDAIEG